MNVYWLRLYILEQRVRESICSIISSASGCRSGKGNLSGHETDRPYECIRRSDQSLTCLIASAAPVRCDEDLMKHNAVQVTRPNRAYNQDLIAKDSMICIDNRTRIVLV